MSGGSIQGTLTDNHMNETAAYNFVNAYDDLTGGYGLVMPKPMAVGTTIEGTISTTKL